MENLWPSLYKYGPDLTPYPDLVEKMLTETHENNLSVPEGHTRYTIDIIQNATWSDGVPLTAKDVAFTFIYIIESGVYGNPAGSDYLDLSVSDATTTYRCVIEFTTESYWLFSDFAFDYIIPEHVLNSTEFMGYDKWNIWNPVFDSDTPNATCGPFTFNAFESGDYYEILMNPLFHYSIDPFDIANTTTPLTSPPPTTEGHSWTPMVTIPTSIGSAVVIMYCLLKIIQKRRESP
ncbi:MAG: hypothetical protein JW779_11670 [Candidatus Thorarchaeota archaeon]|nr:hypothetical protein [Candidatus Thorarchaeota archaeon]